MLLSDVELAAQTWRVSDPLQVRPVCMLGNRNHIKADAVGDQFDTFGRLRFVDEVESSYK